MEKRGVDMGRETRNTGRDNTVIGGTHGEDWTRVPSVGRLGEEGEKE